MKFEQVDEGAIRKEKKSKKYIDFINEFIDAGIPVALVKNEPGEGYRFAAQVANSLRGTIARYGYSRKVRIQQKGDDVFIINRELVKEEEDG